MAGLKVKPPAPLLARRDYRQEGRAYAPAGKMKILTTLVRSKFGGGLKFESDAKMGQKRASKGLIM